MSLLRHQADATILIVLLATSFNIEAHIHRSAAARYAFVHAQPCPATGQSRGRCPGWIVDHIVPLCAGGADAPANMQWQNRPDSLVKDRAERAMCRK